MMLFAASAIFPRNSCDVTENSTTGPSSGFDPLAGLSKMSRWLHEYQTAVACVLSSIIIVLFISAAPTCDCRATTQGNELGPVVADHSRLIDRLDGRVTRLERQPVRNP